MKDVAIVWFRNDLRIHDNEALVSALKHSNQICPVYVFDTRIFQGKTSYGLPKTGVLRAQFILETVENLRQNLSKIGLQLVIRVGLPEIEIFDIAKEIKSSWVFCNRERTEEEVKVQDALEQHLWSIGQELMYTRGKMLYYTSDLPFPINQTPENFISFRREVEKFVEVRKPLPIPDIEANVGIYPSNVGHLPSLSALGYDEQSPKSKLRGGEDHALQQLHTFIFEQKMETDGDVEKHESMLSPYLSTGALSPKMFYHEVKRFYEESRKHKQENNSVVTDLIWRDYCRLLGKKHKNAIFQIGGIRHKLDVGGDVDFGKFEKWINGQTESDKVNTIMLKMAENGYITFAERKLVSLYLIQELDLVWLMGAQYFESILLDYDPCSNYCNWNYLAGLTYDAKELKMNLSHKLR